MSAFGREEEEEDPTFDEVSSMADRLGLKGKDRQNYIDDHMAGLGYEAVQTRSTYVRKQQEEEQQGGAGYGSRWGFGGRQGGGSRPRSQPNSRDGDDRY